MNNYSTVSTNGICTVQRDLLSGQNCFREALCNKILSMYIYIYKSQVVLPSFVENRFFPT